MVNQLHVVHRVDGRGGRRACFPSSIQMADVVGLPPSAWTGTALAYGGGGISVELDVGEVASAFDMWEECRGGRGCRGRHKGTLRGNFRFAGYEPDHGRSARRSSAQVMPGGRSDRSSCATRFFH